MDEMRSLVGTSSTRLPINITRWTQPTMSDREWDALYDELMAHGGAKPACVLPDSPTRRVGGAAAAANFEPHTHLARLWSMDKAQIEEALRGLGAPRGKAAGRGRGRRAVCCRPFPTWWSTNSTG